MKDKKELLDNKQELNDQQLGNVGGGASERDILHKVLCNECSWRAYNVTWDDSFILSREHRLQTGHRDIRIF